MWFGYFTQNHSFMNSAIETNHIGQIAPREIS